jgi:hypothetical protein
VSILDETRYIERLRFFNGQRLLSTDLQGIDDFNRGMRWLHNLSLHQPGIASGFAVHGNKGDREITIKAGYAIDELGREIVLTHPEPLPVPPVASDGKGNPIFYDLTVSYPDDSTLEEAETRDGICLKRGAVRLREEPVFCWVALTMGPDGFVPIDPSLKADIQTHRKIILAQIEVLNCQLNQPVCIVHRPDARPDCGPYIACGKEESTRWRPVRELNKALASQFGQMGLPLVAFTTEINTSSAGFLTVPSYSVNVLGLRSAKDVVILDLVRRVRAAKVDRFTMFLLILVVPLLTSALRRRGSLDQVIRNTVNSWTIAWMGVED